MFNSKSSSTFTFKDRSVRTWLPGIFKELQSHICKEYWCFQLLQMVKGHCGVCLIVGFFPRKLSRSVGIILHQLFSAGAPREMLLKNFTALKLKFETFFIIRSVADILGLYLDLIAFCIIENWFQWIGSVLQWTEAISDAQRMRTSSSKGRTLLLKGQLYRYKCQQRQGSFNASSSSLTHIKHNTIKILQRESLFIYQR